MSARERGADLFGAARAEAEWIPDGWMRARVRREVRRARDEAAGSADGRGPPERR